MRKIPFAPIVGGLAFVALATNAALAASAFTVAEVGLLDGPGAKYASAGRVPVGSRVDVIWCGTTEEWCLVELHRKKGWLPAAILTVKRGKGGTAGDQKGSSHSGGGQAGGGTTDVPEATSGSSHLQLTQSGPQVTQSEPNHITCSGCGGDVTVMTKK